MASTKDENCRRVHPLPYQSILDELLWANKTVIAASSAAVVGVLAGYPFDSVKTRLQTQHYDSMGACIKQTYKEEGFRGFFRGILPPLITVSIIKSISFSVYEESKAFCKTRYPYMKQDTLGSTMAVSTLGGFTSGAFIAALSCPFELVKIQKQLEFLLQASSVSTGATVVRSISENDMRSNSGLRSTVGRTVGAGLPISAMANPCIPPLSPTPTSQSPSDPICHNNKRIIQSSSSSTITPSSSLKSTTTSTTSSHHRSSQLPPFSSKSSSNGRSSTSSWASAKEIIKKKGIGALYNGFGLHFLRDSVGTGVYFGGYETTKYLLTTKDKKSGPLIQFLAGGICGILCWLVVFPIDLVKTLKQKEVLSPTPHYRNARECIANIIRQKGYRGFYSGVSVTLLRAFPIHSLNFLVYEQTLLLVGRLTHHDNGCHDHVSL
ncbi:mitochondrial carrier domain-containing protein [Chlamydoabsidia padenii]|nr:mitochondrial carrier domain-containing protein [Chlamydoabsidia padenii]